MTTASPGAGRAARWGFHRPKNKHARFFLWAACSASFLVLGLGGWVALAASLVSGPPGSVQATRDILYAYGSFVLAKGLLPQLTVGLTLYAIIPDRLADSTERSVYVVIRDTCLCMSIAGVLIVGLLLPSRVFGLPAVVYTDWGNGLATFMEMSTAVIAASLVPAIGCLRLRVRRPMVRVGE